MLAAVRASAADEVVVVAGAHDVETDARVVHAPDWERGPGASLRAGLVTVCYKAEAAVVVLADGPNLDPRAIDRLVEAWRDGAGDALAATYDGANRSHPVLLARSLWKEIPDEGARVLPVNLIPCDDLSDPGDEDVP